MLKKIMIIIAIALLNPVDQKSLMAKDGVQAIGQDFSDLVYNSASKIQKQVKREQALRDSVNKARQEHEKQQELEAKARADQDRDQWKRWEEVEKQRLKMEMENKRALESY